MNFDFLPEKIKSSLLKTDFRYIYGIRLRVNYPIQINYKNTRFFLTNLGLSRNEKNALIFTKEDADYIIDKITFHSVYAYNESIKNGFITTNDGIRIGLSGECVFDKEILTIKNFTSFNIRIPHEIENCSEKIFKYIYNKGEIFNTLIISPPFCGKTTILKDLVKKINFKTDKQILVIDERGEFYSCYGVNVDIIKFSDKLYAFNYGIRSMSPNLVITDEIQSKNDWECVKSAVNSGVNLIASCHSENIEELREKDYFIDRLFERYIVLENGKLGVIYKTFNKDFKEI